MNGSKEWLTVGEAAHSAGRSVSTIKRWISSGSLSAQRDRAGRHMIHFDDLRAVCVQLTDRSSVTVQTAERTMVSSVDASTELLNELRARVRELEARNTRLETLNEKLQSEILRLTAELTAFLNRQDKGFLSRWIKAS